METESEEIIMKKCWIAILLCTLLCILYITATAEKEVTIDDITYYVYEDHAEVHCCNTNAKSAIIASEVKGKPVTHIACLSFSSCRNLTNVTIPDTVTMIEEAAFQDCTSLVNVTIPDSVTSIGNGAFHGCSSLIRITIPNSVTSIGGEVFSGCNGLTSVVIPNSMTSIVYGMFGDCISLKSVTIPDCVTSIENDAL